MRHLVPVVVLLATPALAAQLPPAPSCTEDTRSACWMEVANQPGCRFWHDDRTPGVTADWSGECSSGLAEGSGTVTWRDCILDNGVCMPFAQQQSGSFLNGMRHGRWSEGPSDAAACYRWNTEMYFNAATVEDVIACLDAGADVNASQSGYLGGTPLHHAVWKNDLPMIEVLLNAGAYVDARVNGNTPLLEAAGKSDNPAIYNTLLEAGADVNALSNNWDTPLHELARFNSDLGHQSVALAKILIDAGADMNARQRHGFTPLHFAARRVALPIIELLLEAGAEVDMPNNWGETPLDEAVGHTVYNKTDAIEALLAAGANPMARDEGGLGGSGGRSPPSGRGGRVDGWQRAGRAADGSGGGSMYPFVLVRRGR